MRVWTGTMEEFSTAGDGIFLGTGAFVIDGRPMTRGPGREWPKKLDDDAARDCLVVWGHREGGR